MTSMIFISHATVDNDIVDRIYAALVKAGLTAWVDHQHGITYGDQWAQKIQAAVNECDFGLFVMSPASVKSEWCDAEWNAIRGLGKTLSKKRRKTPSFSYGDIRRIGSPRL